MISYKSFLHTFNGQIKDIIKFDNDLYFFYEDRKSDVHNEIYEVHYVKSIHNIVGNEKLFKAPQEIYDSEYIELSATTLKVLKSWKA